MVGSSSSSSATYKEERDERHYKEVVVSSSRLRNIILGTCLNCLASLSISMVGGLMLLWWETHYHPANRQLWMVPFALILLVTPLFVCSAAFFSDLSNHESSDTTINHCIVAWRTPCNWFVCLFPGYIERKTRYHQYSCTLFFRTWAPTFPLL